MEDESLELALADVEILRSAYPDETSCCCATGSGCSQFPLHVTLHLSETAYIELEIVTGYPVSSNVQVATYRSTAIERQRLERAVALVRATSAQCLEDGTEGGLACCAVAFDAWNDSGVQEALGNVTESSLLNVVSSSSSPTVATFEWISGKPLHDRKSTFQAHMCRLESEADVRPAVQQLLNNSKLQRATHNMVRSHSAGCSSLVVSVIRLLLLSFLSMPTDSSRN